VAVPGVVDDDIEPTELVVGPPDRLEIRGAVGDVEPKRQQAIAEPRGQVGQRMGVARRGRDAVATLERSGRRTPDRNPSTRQ